VLHLPSSEKCWGGGLQANSWESRRQFRQGHVRLFQGFYRNFMVALLLKLPFGRWYLRFRDNTSPTRFGHLALYSALPFTALVVIRIRDRWCSVVVPWEPMDPPR
jgi:hypothetical protein